MSDFTPYFLGPKGENSDFAEDMLLYVFRDYVHWRRNYFPGDKGLTSKAARRASAADFDRLESKVTELSAELRRNFPFYSPRYIAHQLSEVSVPALLGVFAGMLYNPNNVTPEAAPVTVEWEINACNELLKMLGFQPPPGPPAESAADVERYERQLRGEFGWAHLTSGGTVANIEALWVARTVRAFPLALRDAARSIKLPVPVKLPSAAPDAQVDLRRCKNAQLLLLKPNEAIYLLGRFIDSLRKRDSLSVEAAAKRAQEMIRESRFSPSRGFDRNATPPVIFASGAAHYSIQKAADVLGIGRDNVELVDVDSMFRMDIRDLEVKIRRELKSGHRFPLAVVAVAGTTEEGAVDPIHDVVDLRTRLEQENVSFWLHIDAAWAGYFRTLLTPRETDVLPTVLTKIGAKLQVPFDGDPSVWHRALFAGFDAEEASTEGPKAERLSERLDTQLADGNVESYFSALYHAISKHERQLSAGAVRRHDFGLSVDDRIRILRQEVADTVRIEYGRYRRDIAVEYGNPDVCKAFVAFPYADSITIDPHKMGYMPYACGAVAFRNDRVRHFITQRAPYITAASHNVLVHNPPRHRDVGADGQSRVSIDAFAPFMLEGSKPGATAAGLWLSTQMMPLDLKGHGQIIKASVLAARELYEWLQHWAKVSRHNGSDDDYELVPYTASPPDTNIVIFAVRKRNSRSLAALNAVTNAVYESFTIQAELGDREYSYSQPFFLSRTTFDCQHYNFGALAEFLEARCDIRNAREQYEEFGCAVLRASVMTPYITALRQSGLQFVMREFVRELSVAARAAVTSVPLRG